MIALIFSLLFMNNDDLTPGQLCIMKFSYTDTNQDNYLSMGEFMFGQDEFDFFEMPSIDADGDDQVSADEWVDACNLKHSI